MAKKDYSIFEGMSLNPFAVPDGKGMDHYKMFKNAVFWKRDFATEDADGEYLKCSLLDINKLISFIVLLIDPESPFADERNFDLRVNKCKRILDIDKEGFVAEEIQREGDMYVSIMFELFKRINNHVYETWFSMKMNLHQFSSYLRKSPIPDRNGSVAQDINARRQLAQIMPELTFELIEIEMQLFPDDRLQRLISERSSDDGLGGPAEQYAEEPKYNKK